MNNCIHNIQLRLAEESDCQLLWQWSNDSEVRLASFYPEPIPWKNHVQWFHQKLNDPTTILYIANIDYKIPIGQVRFEQVEEGAVISISLDQQFRGLGYGSQLIRLASDQVSKSYNITQIHAYIKQNNPSSLQAFLKAGFKFYEMTTIKGHLAIHCIRLLLICD